MPDAKGSEKIFEGVKDVLKGVLRINPLDLDLDSQICCQLGADNIHLLEIASDLNQKFDFKRKLEKKDFFPEAFCLTGLDVQLTPAILESIQETLGPSVDLGHINLDSCLKDVFTVRLLCQTVASHLEVGWRDPYIYAP